MTKTQGFSFTDEDMEIIEQQRAKRLAGHDEALQAGIERGTKNVIDRTVYWMREIGFQDGVIVSWLRHIHSDPTPQEGATLARLNAEIDAHRAALAS